MMFRLLCGLCAIRAIANDDVAMLQRASLLQRGAFAQTNLANGLNDDSTSTAQTCAEALAEYMGGDAVNALSSGFNPSAICPSGAFVHHLGASDFESGTLKILSAGYYKLTENISMAPGGNRISYMMPDKNNMDYPFSDGYWLGFFAAISVQSDNVFIDLGGYTLAQSKEFNARQRFFQTIQLGSKPFNAGVGPPQFGALDQALVKPSNVAIVNGVLGLTSHIGIHGNEVENIWVHNVHIKDFEVGGIQINGAKAFHIENVEIGPSSVSTPALATLSQAQNLLRILEAENLHVDGRDELRQAVNAKVAGSSVSVFDLPSAAAGRPDGSAVYGILFHKLGPAIHEFMSCTDADQQMSGLGPVTLKNVNVHGLRLHSDEVVAVLDEENKRVLGPAGDVVQVFRARDQNGVFESNPLIRVQIALAKEANNHTGEDAEERFAMFGSTNIPTSVLSWADNSAPLPDLGIVCHKDSMGHHNKGVVGIRLNSMTNANLVDVQISDLANSGSRSPLCGSADDTAYHGSDVRGITTGYTALQFDNVVVNNLVSETGAVQPFDNFDNSYWTGTITYNGEALQQMLSSDPAA